MSEQEQAEKLRAAEDGMTDAVKPLTDVFRSIADEPIDGLDRMTWRAAWLAAARIVEEAKPIIQPGLCWHDSGIQWPTGWSPRCELLAGHTGAHQCDRGSMGGTAVWTEAATTHEGGK